MDPMDFDLECHAAVLEALKEHQLMQQVQLNATPIRTEGMFDPKMRQPNSVLVLCWIVLSLISLIVTLAFWIALPGSP